MPIHAIVTMLSLAALGQAAPKSIAPAQAKQVVERSLTGLQEDGVQWIRRRLCNSCHHVGFMVWSLNEAQRHGLAVNKGEVARWTDWALKYATYRGTSYQITDGTLAALKKANLAEDKLDLLKNLKQTFATEADFREELVRILPAGVLGQHKEVIFKTAVKLNQGGAGEDGPDDKNATVKHSNGPGTVAAELLLGGAPSLSPSATEATKLLVKRLIDTQRKDGSWKHGNQLEALNRPSQESVEVNTIWNVLALAAVGNPPEAAETRARALAFLKATRPGVSTESHVVHALLAQRQGDAERAGVLLKELIAQQLPDGGWSWLKGNKQSDALTTGQMLYALGLMGRDNSDPSVQRAWSFLARTQRPDGDWLVPSGNLRKKGDKKSTDPIFSYWGTAWAAIGILQTLPKEK